MKIRYCFYKRRLRHFVVHNILHADDPPYCLAMGLAIGVFATFTPALGLQMISMVVLASLLRANKLVGLPVAWLTNPVTFVPIYYPLYRLGAWTMGDPALDADAFLALIENSPEGWWASIIYYFNQLLVVAWPLWIGCLLFAIPAAIVTYFVAYYVICAYRMKRWNSLTPPPV